VSIEIDYLANHTESLEEIANWYEDEWGYLRELSGLPPYIERLPEYLNTEKLPLMVLARLGGVAVATAQLKFREMDIYPDYEHWLGGVYVAKDHRLFGIASRIVERVILEAERFGIRRLYLQTEKLDGGLYRRLGWEPLERVEYMGRSVLVMSRSI